MISDEAGTTPDIDIRLKQLVEQAALSLDFAAHTATGTLAPAQQRVLQTLHAQGAMTQQRLLDELGLAPASLSELLAKLEAKGIIMRGHLESDRRIRTIDLTQAGEGVANRIASEEEGIAHDAFGALSKEEKAQLEALLTRLVDRSDAS